MIVFDVGAVVCIGHYKSGERRGDSDSLYSRRTECPTTNTEADQGSDLQLVKITTLLDRLCINERKDQDSCIAMMQ